MKKVYYLCHCVSGTSVWKQLLELVKEEGNKLTFHFETYDWDYNKTRVITFKAYRKERLNFDRERVEYIDFKSSKEQFRYHFIKEVEIPDDQEPEKLIIEH